MPQISEAGYELFAVSYDPPEVLAAFSEAYGITFDLLSDPGSRVIQDLGLINAHIEQQQAFYGFTVAERHRGLPYPGTFVLDERGVVVNKHFDQSYRDRPSGTYLLSEMGATGATGSYEARAVDAGLQIRAWVEEPTYRPMQRTVLHARVDLVDGFHVYTEPIPAGYVPLSFEIHPADGLETWPVEMPEGRPFTVEGLDERFHVVSDTVEVAIPFKVSGTEYLVDGRSRPQPLESDSITLTLVVRFQACTDSECFPPTERRLLIPLVEAALVK